MFPENQFPYKIIPSNVETNDDGSVLITFAERQRAITPGQYAVLYMPIENGAFACLGGGQIDTVIKNI
jgi:tRNA-specific 2-thiouridylase